MTTALVAEDEMETCENVRQIRNPRYWVRRGGALIFAYI